MRADGIDPVTIIEAGTTINTLHLFIDMCQEAGGRIIGKVVGVDMNGMLNRCPMTVFKKIGSIGRKTGIGRKTNHGAFMRLGGGKTGNSRIEIYLGILVEILNESIPVTTGDPK